MKATIIVDIDSETQTVHIGEENGSGCMYSYHSMDDAVNALSDYLYAVMQYDK